MSRNKQSAWKRSSATSQRENSNMNNIDTRTTSNTNQTVSNQRLVTRIPLSARPDIIGMRLAQQERRHRLKMMRKQEYQRLRAMVPTIATKPKVSKVTVIEEAIRYIDHLHSALLTRLRTRGLPQCLQGTDINMSAVDEMNIRDLVQELVSRSNTSSTPTTVTTDNMSPEEVPAVLSMGPNLERSRPLPSYLIRAQKRK